MHYALACGTALVATFLSPSLRAQTIESIPKNSTAVEWSNVDGTRQQGDLYWTVRQVDCEDDVSLLFHLNVNDPSRGTFQVWAGQSDCTVQENRTGTNPKCWNLYTGRLTDSKPTIEVSARDIARRLDGDGSVNDCRRTDSEFSLNLYFMHVSGDQTIGTGTQFAMSLDLVGPAAPTGVSVGLREESLAVEWTASVSTDIQGYRLYCEPMGGWENPFLNETSARFGRVVQASTLELDAGTPEAGTGAAGGEASSTGGASAAGGDSAGATADGVGGANSSSVGASTCQGSVLEEGQIPSPDYEPCGKVGPQSERGIADHLQNDLMYAVGVAAFDNVGNIGPLSAVNCETPRDLTGAFDAYREAGGKGGGGFCGVSSRGQDSRTSVSGWLLATLAALCFGRRHPRRFRLLGRKT